MFTLPNVNYQFTLHLDSGSFAEVLTGALFCFPPENQQIILIFHISKIILIEAKIFFKDIGKLKRLNFIILFHCEFSMNFTMSIY